MKWDALQLVRSIYGANTNFLLIQKDILKKMTVTNHSTNSKISPGWQFNALQIASSVLKRTAFALPVFNMERLDKVKSTFSESSFKDIFLLAIITSKFTIIGISYTVNSFSDWISTPLLNIWASTYTIPARKIESPDMYVATSP